MNKHMASRQTGRCSGIYIYQFVAAVLCWFMVLSLGLSPAVAAAASLGQAVARQADSTGISQSSQASQAAEGSSAGEMIGPQSDAGIPGEETAQGTEHSENTGGETVKKSDQPDGLSDIRLYMDGEEIVLADPILNIGNRTYLPLRSFCEILGAEVIWRQEQNSVSVVRNRVEVVFTVDSDVYIVNGVARHMLDASLYLDHAISRVYVPIRYEAEIFGFEVAWVSDVGSQTIFLSSTPVSEGELTDNEITIGGKIVWIGQSEQQLVASLGYPSRIDESAYNLQWFIYNRDYREFIMVGLRDQKVCGFFSNCERIGLKGGLSYGAGKSDVESAGLGKDGMDFWFDPHDNERLFAVFCMAEAPGRTEQQAIFEQKAELLLRAYEMECFDITNAFRVASGKPLVLYNIYAAKVALAYAKEMADKNFLDHVSPEGDDPLDRFEAQGVYVKQVSENLAGGFSDAMHVIQGWVESASHRKGMLEENQYLGVGAHYRPASRYRYYFVQEFITLD